MKILDPIIYDRAKQIVYTQYKKPSAYRSGALQRKYKELGGRYAGNRQKGNLTRWFSEQWQDIAGLGYPVYRPTRRISTKTPLLEEEIEPSDLIIKAFQKQKVRGTRNLSPFRRR